MEIYKEVPEKFHDQFMETIAILEQKDNENKPLFTFKEKTKISLFEIRKLAAAALVAVILGTLTVSTNAEALEKVMEIVEKIVIKKPLAEKMHIESEEEEENIIVEEISDGEKTSVQQGEVAVCVEQVISDGEDAYIYLSVELPQNLEVEKWKTGEDRLYFRQNEIRINDNVPERVNFTLKHLEENQAYGIVYISLEKVGEGNCQVSLTLNNLDYAVFAGEEKGWDIQRLVEETWELNWSFSCEKIAKSYKAEATIDAHDGTVMTKEAVVSPLSVRVTGSIECDDPTYSQVSCYIDSVILKDGIIEDYDANYCQIEEETKKYNMKWYFKRMIPIEDVIGVVVNGEYIYFY
ncbi:MAG: hypothetical protein IKL49_05910 [Lachnospiraceae bacterium]|nr:hypothetical protein [Lachnospiraceae bacterium]